VGITRKRSFEKIVLLSLFVFAGMLFAQQAQKTFAQKPGADTLFTKAKAQATRENKKILVFFDASW